MINCLKSKYMCVFFVETNLLRHVGGKCQNKKNKDKFYLLRCVIGNCQNKKFNFYLLWRVIGKCQNKNYLLWRVIRKECLPTPSLHLKSGFGFRFCEIEKTRMLEFCNVFTVWISYFVCFSVSNSPWPKPAQLAGEETGRAHIQPVAAFQISLTQLGILLL